MIDNQFVAFRVRKCRRRSRRCGPPPQCDGEIRRRRRSDLGVNGEVQDGAPGRMDPGRMLKVLGRPRFHHEPDQPHLSRYESRRYRRRFERNHATNHRQADETGVGRHACAHHRRWNWWAGDALSLQKAGIEATVFEAVPEIRPLGVGINMLPHVRELTELDCGTSLAVGIKTRVGYASRHGQQIWQEDRGCTPGTIGRNSRLPGALQMILLRRHGPPRG